MLFHITVLDNNQSDVPYMVFAVHAPEDTPHRVLQEVCIRAMNEAIVKGETLPDPDDFWDGQLDDPATEWCIQPVEPLRLSPGRVAHLAAELGVRRG